MAIELNTDPRAMARAKLEARRERISLIRRRVATGTIVAFVLSLGGLFYQDVTGGKSQASAAQSSSTEQTAGSAGVDGGQISIPSAPSVTSVTSVPSVPSVPLVTSQS